MSESVDSVDITKLNALAAGTNRKTPRIVAAGVGGRLMGTKSLVNVTADQITEDSMKQMTLAEKDEAERQKYTRETHISDQPWTFSNWYQHINWLNLMLVVVFPLYGMWEATKHPLQWKTALLGFILFWARGF